MQVILIDGPVASSATAFTERIRYRPPAPLLIDDRNLLAWRDDVPRLE